MKFALVSLQMQLNHRPQSMWPLPGKALGMLLEPMVWVLALLALLTWVAAVVIAFGWALDTLVGRTPVMIGAGILSLLILTFLLQGYFQYKMKHARQSLMARGFHWIFHIASNHQARLVILVALLLMSIGLLFCGTMLGWRLLPEVLADWVGMMVGIMSTPFLLEVSFIFIGLTIVIAINHYRQKRAGDEFVELEVKDQPKH